MVFQDRKKIMKIAQLSQANSKKTTKVLDYDTNDDSGLAQ